MDCLIENDELTNEGMLALYLCRDFARAGMSPEKIADTACQVATQVFARMRCRAMLLDQKTP